MLCLEGAKTMEAKELSIPGVYQFDLTTHYDGRGHFTEIFRKMWFTQPYYYDWNNLQVNASYSKKNVLRGLHYHLKQADYWYVAMGRIQVGLMDINTEQYLMLELDTKSGLLIPQGVAHGFLALEDTTLIYLVNQYYNPEDEYNIPWNTLDWQIDNPIISERDG